MRCCKRIPPALSKSVLAINEIQVIQDRCGIINGGTQCDVTVGTNQYEFFACHIVNSIGIPCCVDYAFRSLHMRWQDGMHMEFVVGEVLQRKMICAVYKAKSVQCGPRNRSNTLPANPVPCRPSALGARSPGNERIAFVRADGWVSELDR